MAKMKFKGFGEESIKNRKIQETIDTIVNGVFEYDVVMFRLKETYGEHCLYPAEVVSVLGLWSYLDDPNFLGLSKEKPSKALQSLLENFKGEMSLMFGDEDFGFKITKKYAVEPDPFIAAYVLGIE